MNATQLWAMRKIGHIGICLGLLVTGSVLQAQPEGPLPVSGTLRQTIDEDSYPRGFHMILQARDSDGPKVEWLVANPPGHGEAEVAGVGKNKAIIYVPENNWNGEDRFTLALDDGFGGRSELEVVVTVRPQNDPPQNRVRPSLSGIPALGEELHVEPGVWDDQLDGEEGILETAIQWQIASRPDPEKVEDLEGEISEHLLLREDMDGSYVRAVVTVTEVGEDALSAQEASSFFKVGNTMPAFVLVAPLQTMPSHHPTPSEATVEVDRIVFVGNDSIPSEELESLVARFTGRRVSLTELQYAAAEVTSEYRRRGMILAKAYLPAQEVADGSVEMQVLEGRLGQLTVEGNTRYSEEFVRRHLEDAMSGEVVSNRELESGLLLMNEEYPGLNVQAVLKPGQAPGTVGIHAVVEEDKPWTVTAGYNNFGSDAVSQNRFELGGEINHVAFDGDRLAVEAVTSEQPGELAQGSFLYEAPVSFSGTKVGIQAASGFFEVGKRFADLGLEGDSESLGLFVRHPFIKSREWRLTGEVGLFTENAGYEILGETITEDHVRTVYTSLYASGNHGGGSTSAIVNLTQGLNELIGGSTQHSDGTSRPGADNKFTRLTASLARRQSLTSYAAFLVRMSGQIASDTLLASQEWQIGGEDSVRGYHPAEGVGDEGAQASAELQLYPFSGQAHQMVMFMDYGYASRGATLVAESNSINLSGAGIGFRYFLNGSKMDGLLRLDIGWPMGSEENDAGDDPVLYFATELKF